MDRYAGHLRGEAYQQQQPYEMPEALTGYQSVNPRLLCHQNQVEVVASESACEIRVRGRVEVHHEDADEHEDASSERVDEELHGCVFPVLTAPDHDQEEHRDKGELPEHVEHEQIQRDEYPNQGPLHNQEE